MTSQGKTCGQNCEEVNKKPIGKYRLPFKREIFFTFPNTSSS